MSETMIRYVTYKMIKNIYTKLAMLPGYADPAFSPLGRMAYWRKKIFFK